MNDSKSQIMHELSNRGIITEPGEDDQIHLTEEFRHKKEEMKPTIKSANGFRSCLKSFTENSLYDIDDLSNNEKTRIISLYKVLKEYEISKDQIGKYTKVTHTIDAVANNPHVPTGFIPIPGSKINQFLSIFSDSIIYYWKEDCPTCVNISETLSQIVTSDIVTEDVGLASVYGPKYSDVIRSEYDVGVAPTVICFTRSTPEIRFVGKQEEQYLETELKQLYSADKCVD